MVPVSYVWDDNRAYIVTDYRTRKLKNLRENPQAAILVDSGGTRKLILISGPAEIIEKGKEYQLVIQAVLFKAGLGQAGPLEGRRGSVRQDYPKIQGWLGPGLELE